jgi:hypothetical protein
MKTGPPNPELTRLQTRVDVGSGLQPRPTRPGLNTGPYRQLAAGSWKLEAGSWKLVYCPSGNIFFNSSSDA